MSADISDLPDLVDVSDSANLNDSGLNQSIASKPEEEEEFRPVVSKRKRRQEKMEMEESKSNKKSSSQEIKKDNDDDDEDDIEPDMEELEEILEEKPEDNQPLKKIKFPAISNEKLMDGSVEFRKVHVPPNRFTPLKDNWMKIYSPVVEYLKLQIRFNLKTRNVEIKVIK